MVGGATATSYAPRAPGRVGDVEAIRGRPDRKQEGRAASREGKDEQWAQEGVVRSRQTGVHPAPHYLSLRPFPVDTQIKTGLWVIFVGGRFIDFFILYFFISQTFSELATLFYNLN